jgi:hypothetical protein
MIYCVVPPELKDELYDTLVEHFRDNPDVEVIVDRRHGPDRRSDRRGGGHRTTRDRRRPRVPGSFLPTDPPAQDDP